MYTNWLKSCCVMNQYVCKDMEDFQDAATATAYREAQRLAQHQDDN